MRLTWASPVPAVLATAIALLTLWTLNAWNAELYGTAFPVRAPEAVDDSRQLHIVFSVAGVPRGTAATAWPSRPAVTVPPFAAPSSARPVPMGRSITLTTPRPSPGWLQLLLDGLRSSTVIRSMGVPITPSCDQEFVLSKRRTVSLCDAADVALAAASVRTGTTSRARCLPIR